MISDSPIDTRPPLVASPSRTATEHFEVLIVGAGLSGVGAACHLKMRTPFMSYAILEARPASGGTWDLFRYPGIRSDSDMYTLGYAFKPWTNAKAIADGPSILSYIRETADEYGVTPRIRFNQRVKRADWSSADARWYVEVERTDTGTTLSYSASFLIMASGYYSYEAGHTPEFPNASDFKGQIVHPQFWPEQLDYTGKRVVVIGSGATAVTLVPSMTENAEHVTMLQRSPTYVLSRPGSDAIAMWLMKRVPAWLAYSVTRWKNVGLATFFFQLSRRRPERVKALIAKTQRKALPESFDMSHFTPSYNPWDQRVCLVPDSDLFKVLSNGKASIVTDHIDTFTATGIRLKSGKELPADIIVTATGLKLNVLGDVKFSIDGELLDLSKKMTYKGCMLDGVPNLATIFGYTNASWTLKADLTSEWLCRLFKHMRAGGFASVRPRRDASVNEAPFLDFSSGYVVRALEMLPKQGDKKPWKLFQNYMLDLVSFRRAKFDDGVLEFTKKTASGKLARR